MNNSDYNKAENAVDQTENSLKNAADNAKWKISELADKAKDYINEKEIMIRKLHRKTGWKE